jgi:hypothetical protein
MNTDTDYIDLFRVAVSRNDPAREASDLARLHHLLEEQDPQGIEVIDRGQALDLGETLRNVPTLGELGGHQRASHYADGITGHLAHDTEHFAEIADLHAQVLGHLRERLLIGIELLGQPVTPSFLPRQLTLDIPEQGPLVVPLTLETLFALLILRGHFAARFFDILQELVKRLLRHD